MRKVRLVICLCTAVLLFVLLFTSNNDVHPRPDSQMHTSFTEVYRTSSEGDNLNCPDLISGTFAAFYFLQRRIVRPAYNGSFLNTSCEAIKNRLQLFTSLNTGFPVAYAKIVYKDYDFLEEQLAMNYAAENTYCFSVDKKAPPSFKSLIRNLAKCVENVFVPDLEFDVDSAGHFTNHAHLECMKTIRHREWRYIILMQNHDVLIKTHKQIADILRLYGGANDIQVRNCPAFTCPSFLERRVSELKLWPRNASSEALSSLENATLVITKGAVQAAISREAADFVIDKLDYKMFLIQLNAMGYGVDELFWPTLQGFEGLKLPGGFTSKCANSSTVGSAVRFVDWLDSGCLSGAERHSVCVLGTEYLHILAERPEILANKMLPDFDYGAVSCLSELLWLRNQGILPNTINTSHYEQLNFVRYNSAKTAAGSATFNSSSAV